jgi:hypothetical protein
MFTRGIYQAASTELNSSSLFANTAVNRIAKLFRDKRKEAGGAFIKLRSRADPCSFRLCAAPLNLCTPIDQIIRSLQAFAPTIKTAEYAEYAEGESAGMLFSAYFAYSAADASCISENVMCASLAARANCVNR